MTEIEVKAQVMLEPSQVSAIIADYFAHQSLKVERIAHACGPGKVGPMFNGGPPIEFYGSLVILDPQFLAGERAVQMPDVKVKTLWNEEKKKAPRGTEYVI